MLLLARNGETGQEERGWAPLSWKSTYIVVSRHLDTRLITMAPQARPQSRGNAPQPSTTNSHDAKDEHKNGNSRPPTREEIEFERKRRLESSKAAKEALEAKKKAAELREAAKGAGDPEERQKLLEEAIDREAQAESFGKVAKYMRSGTFQGMAFGAGLGVIPGLELGALTGTLVGGTVSLITGGIGAAGGALTGFLHGPFFNVGEVAGQGIRKITGDGPKCGATEEQKRHLEKMIGQCKDEEMPSDLDLQELAEWSEGPDGLFLGGKGGKWSGYASAAMPSHATKTKMKSKANISNNPTPERLKAATRQPIQVGPGKAVSRPAAVSAQKSMDRKQVEALADSTAKPLEQQRKKPRKLEIRSQSRQDVPKTTDGKEQKKPKKLESRT